MVDSTNLPNVDINQIATDLNGKMDRDCLNASDTGNIQMAKASMPSSTYTDLTLGASGSTYTAPADGWFFIDKRATSSGQYLELANRTSGIGKQSHAATQYDNLSVFIPAISGDTVMAGYSANGATNAFRFIYAQGAKSEIE